MTKIIKHPIRLSIKNINTRLAARTGLILIVYLVLFILLDRFSIAFQILPGIVAWYPPDGLSFALLLVFGGGFWPVVAVATLISNFLVFQVSFSPLAVLAWGVFVAVVYSIAAEVLRRRVRIDPQLRSLRDVVWLILAAGLASGILATVSVSASVASHSVVATGFFDEILHWWIGEVVGILAVTPFLLIYVRPGAKKFVEGGWNPSLTQLHLSRPTAKIVGQTLSLLIALYLAFGVRVLGQFQPLYILAIPLTWIALQYGISGVSLGIAAANFGTAVALLVYPIDLSELPELQLLMLVICATGLLTGVVVTERRKTVDELRVSEGRFRSLYENATLGIYRTTPEGQILLANPALIKMLGYSSLDDLTQRNLESEGYEPDNERSKFRAQIDAEGALIGYQSAWTRKDGATLFVRESAKAIRDASGKTLYYEGTVEDFTEQKRAEEDLHTSLERYNRTLKNMLEGCQIIDFDWRYIYVNDAAAHQGRHEPVELLMHTMMEMYPGIENTELFGTLHQCMQERVPKQIENEFIYADGTSNWFELSIQPVPEGLFILSMDISDRKRADLTLQQSEKRFRSLIENSSDAITLLDENGIAIYDSPAAPGMLGYFQGELVGWNVFDLIHSDDLLQTKSLFQRLAAAPGSRVKSIFRLRHKGGSWLWIEAVATNLMTEPSVKAVVVNYRDITQRKQAEEKIQNQLDHLNALRDIDTVIASSFGMDISLRTVLLHVVQQLGVDAAAVQLLNPASNTLSYVSGRGFRTEAFKQANPLRLGTGYAGRAALDRRAIHVSDLGTQNESARLAKVLAGEDFVSYFGVPLVAKGKVNGVLEVFHRATLEPSEDWLAFLNTLAGQAAIAIDNASLFENLQHSNNGLIMAYDATIEGWSRALDLRDKETEGHTQRVTEMTVRLAKAFEMSEEELVQVRRGALLHDIGKMGVPDHILLKPGKLTDEEWVAMRKHPQFAYDMLSPIRYLQQALDIPYCHHEKWDGTGYPRGLKGEQIPISARIFAVVDVYDALTSDRPYREGWHKKTVLEHIQSLSGTHFDPHVVEISLPFIEENY